MHIWLAFDAKDETTGRPRVAVQDRPFEEDHLPRGMQARGEAWEYRELDVPEPTWTDLLAGGLSPDEQDELHLKWWEETS